MGCYNIQGCISQLPIMEHDRVAGILCKINSSLDYSNIINYVCDYTLIPMCPIIYGEYDEYGGLKPDKSETVNLLEEFFENPINEIINSFVVMTSLGANNNYGDVLKNLIYKRDMEKPRTIKVYDTPSTAPKTDNEILSNHWCLVLEHEDVVKTIINNNDDITLKGFFGDRIPIKWDKLYDEQLELFKEFNLDKYNNTDINYKLAFDITHKYIDVLFPINDGYIPFSCVMNGYCMDLFKNYPDMFHYAFDKKLKNEYLDTLKFYNVIKTSQIHMYINKDVGQQWQNINLWKNLITIYNEIITPKRHTDY